MTLAQEGGKERGAGRGKGRSAVGFHTSALPVTETTKLMGTQLSIFFANFKGLHNSTSNRFLAFVW
jgi:hypothetical protein